VKITGAVIWEAGAPHVIDMTGRHLAEASQ
jgi:hypothetical protein